MEDGLRPPTAPRDDTTGGDPEPRKNPNTKRLGMLGLTLIVLVLVVWLLPTMVPVPTDEQQATNSGAEVKPDVEQNAPSTMPDHYRADAEQALQGFLRLQAQPDLANAQVWAADAWQEAIGLADRGDDKFGEGYFIAALESYQDASKRLQTILQDRDQTLQNYLESGWEYLESDAVEEATGAFERALAMQSLHPQAKLGLTRSLVREQVLELVTTAQQAEISRELAVAAGLYTRALELDSMYLPAKNALEKVNTEIRNLAFQYSLGRALAHIDKGEFANAEEALAEAAGIYPSDEAIADARKRLQAERRQARLTVLRREAEQLESTESWTAANQRYLLALKIDPQAAFARNGREKSQEKMQLHKRLDHYLGDVTRLYSDDPLNNARALLAAHQGTPRGEPVLVAKLEKLQQAVQLAVIPVDLLITSDNMTEVTIYKVGKLGVFLQKQLSLRPGTYTVKGSRRGYRDVLKTVRLQPGDHDESLDIRSEEQI